MSLQEATGEVYLKMNGDLYELGGIKINIYDDDNIFIASLLSESDGHFSLRLKTELYKNYVCLRFFARKAIPIS